MIAMRKRNIGVKALFIPVKPAAFLLRKTINVATIKAVTVMIVKITGIIYPLLLFNMMTFLRHFGVSSFNIINAFYPYR